MKPLKSAENMKKTRLLALLDAVQARVPMGPMLVAGSQSAHALDGAETPAVEASLEVDLLLIGEQFKRRDLINQEFGEQSAFFRRNGTAETWQKQLDLCSGNSMSTLTLEGCTPEPLMNYLKALGVLRREPRSRPGSARRIVEPAL